jgi:hypothetical protein
LQPETERGEKDRGTDRSSKETGPHDRFFPYAAAPVRIAGDLCAWIEADEKIQQKRREENCLIPFADGREG